MPQFDKELDFAVTYDACVGCNLCMMSCSFVKHRVYDQSVAYIKVTKDSGPDYRPERFFPEFQEACDSCGFCLEFCYFGAIVNTKRPKELLELGEPQMSSTYREALDEASAKNSIKCDG